MRVLCFRLRDLLFVVYGEKQIVLETMAAMRGPASPRMKDFGDLRQPHVHMGLEMHGAMGACQETEAAEFTRFRIAVLFY